MSLCTRNLSVQNPILVNNNAVCEPSSPLSILDVYTYSVNIQPQLHEGWIIRVSIFMIVVWKQQLIFLIVALLMVAECVTANKTISLNDLQTFVTISASRGQKFMITSSRWQLSSPNFYTVQCHTVSRNFTLEEDRQLYAVRETGWSLGDIVIPRVAVPNIIVTTHEQRPLPISCMLSEYTQDGEL